MVTVPDLAALPVFAAVMVLVIVPPRALAARVR